jgi:hypothetical protein
MTDLKEMLIDNQYDYLGLYNHPKTIKKLTIDEREINFIVGIKNRTEFFNATIKNLIKSINYSTIKIKLIVVEQNDEPLNFTTCNDLDIEYIFIPQEISKSGNLHSTSLMYNVGYLFSKEAKYNMFHCADILLPHNFFIILEKFYLNKSFNWIQPFSNKRVITFDEKTTDLYLNNVFEGVDPDILPEDCLHPENSGAPGGCICIPTNIMDKIGGYDPELFSAYSPEDAFIWVKLECITKNEQINKTHVGGALYADNPEINLYHFKHPRAQNENPDYELMLGRYESFIKDFTYREQLEYINTKSEIFVKIKTALNEKSVNNIL